MALTMINMRYKANYSWVTLGVRIERGLWGIHISKSIQNRNYIFIL